MPRALDPVIEHGSTVSLYQTLLIFEKQFTADLAIFSNNINAEKPADLSRIERFSQQISNCIEGVILAGKERAVPFWMINMKLKQALILLSQIDQLHHKDIDFVTNCPRDNEAVLSWQRCISLGFL